MEICVCGGGNIAHSFVGELGLTSDLNINVITRRPSEWADSLDVYYDNIFHHKSYINSVSNNFKIFENADIIILTLPANIRFDYLKKIKDYVNEKTLLISAPSTGGINFLFDEVFPENKYVCFQRVPYISRTKEYGHSVNTDVKKEVKAYFSNNCSIIDKEMISKLTGVNIIELESYYTLFLSNSNPILHIAGILELLKGDYPYKQNYPLYDIWNDNTSDYALNMDKELEVLMNKLNVSEYTNLYEHYGINSVKTLTDKLKSIPSFKQVMAPLIYQDGSYILDINSRYFQEDIPFGTCFIKLYAQLNDIDTPYIDNAIKTIQPFMKEEFINKDNLLNTETLSKYVKNINSVIKTK